MYVPPSLSIAVQTLFTFTRCLHRNAVPAHVGMFARVSRDRLLPADSVDTHVQAHVHTRVIAKKKRRKKEMEKVTRHGQRRRIALLETFRRLVRATKNKRGFYGCAQQQQCPRQEALGWSIDRPARATPCRAIKTETLFAGDGKGRSIDRRQRQRRRHFTYSKKSKSMFECSL